MSNLIKIEKDSAILRVHPDVVEAHQSAGWNVSPDQSNEPVAAAADIVTADLRSAYEAKFGKRPFMGWDAETLREKMAEAGE